MNSPTDKLIRLEQLISAQKTLAIMYSGGLDSALLAVITQKVLGERHLCVLVDSPLVPRRDVERARRIAGDFGINLTTVRFDPLGIPPIRNNTQNRCYCCKKEICRIVKQTAGEAGIETVADGTNQSDTGEYRPGNRATLEEGIFHPFVEAGIGKEDIQNIAKEMELDFRDVPSSACLASRIPYDEELDTGKLNLVEMGENILLNAGFKQCRLRLHDNGNIARIEVPSDDIPGFMSREDIPVKLRSLKIPYITLDLDGYRTGSFDLKR